MSCHKKCTKCGEVKLLTDFHKRSEGQLGRTSHCKVCRNAYRMTRPRSANYRKTNLESYYRNPDPYRKARAKRRAAELQRAVQWDDSEWQEFAIAEIYECRRLRTEATGVPHEVDHIVPLQGTLVSGLHRAENLRVITQYENRTKGNALP